jgi:hypothetical protein
VPQGPAPGPGTRRQQPSASIERPTTAACSRSATLLLRVPAHQREHLLLDGGRAEGLTGGVADVESRRGCHLVGPAACAESHAALPLS